LLLGAQTDLQTCQNRQFSVFSFEIILFLLDLLKNQAISVFALLNAE